MRKLPGSKIPMMSPAKASSVIARSCAMNCWGCAKVIFLPVRMRLTVMFFSYWPEQILMNAILSRWEGSMFAWILKTKPENIVSSGSIMPSVELCEAGSGAIFRKCLRNGSTPKLVMAEPKKTGVSCP